MVKQQLICSSWLWMPDSSHRQEKVFTIQESTCWPSSCSPSLLGKLWSLSLPFSHTDYCESHLLLGFRWHILTMYWNSPVSDWQMNDRCHSDVIHLHYLSSVFFFLPCYLQVSKQKNFTSPKLQLLSCKLSCALHICLLHFQIYRLWISFVLGAS